MVCLFGRAGAARGARARALCSSCTSRTYPILRLPTTVFPLHTVSLPIVKPNMHERPAIGCITIPLAAEIGSRFGGKVVLLADGATAGVVVDILSPTAGMDRELPTSNRDRVEWGPGDLVHTVGGERVHLVQMGERTSAGLRLGSFERLVDEELSSDRSRALEDEVTVARALLEASANGKAFELLLCTLDEELGMPDVHPSSHPLFMRFASQPDDPVALGWWLAARLSLTTVLRRHLLSVPCPLKRMIDLVDALRLLHDPSAHGTAQASRRDGGVGSKLRLMYDTAEASGCELEAPRPVVDWSASGQPEASRY